MDEIRVCFLSILGEPGTFDPSVYDNIPGGADERAWILNTFGGLDGVRLSAVAVSHGEAVPDPADADGFILGGSYNSVHDGYAWQAEVRDWFDRLRGTGKPLLGICGGHQLMALHAGSDVEMLPGGFVAATDPVDLTAAGRSSPLFDGFAGDPEVHFANQEHVTAPPDGAVLLARHPLVPVAALDYGNGWYSTQFHPEATVETLGASWRATHPEYAQRYRETGHGARIIGNFVAAARSGRIAA